MNQEEFKEIEEETKEKNERRKTKPAFIVAAFIALVALLGVSIWYFVRSSDSRSGRPVPAPRSLDFETSDTGEIPSGQTITIEPDQLRNADIKIETVGEQINAEQISAAATGVVQANAYRDTPVISLVGGVVRRIPIEAGEYVQKGAPVAFVFSSEYAEAQSRYLTLLTERENARRNFERTRYLVEINQSGRGEYEQAESRLKTAEAELDEHHRHHERTEKLLRIGAASREDLEQATTKLKSAEAAAKEARLRFERAEKLLAINPQSRAENEEAQNKLRAVEAELAAVRQRLILYGMPPSHIDALRSVSQISSEVPVYAPVSGTVTNRAVNAGETVEANKELARITNLSSVWVVAQVFEKDLARIRPGSGASVVTDAFPERIFRGTVTYIDPRLDEATRTAQVRVELENAENLLKIGMYVRVAFGALGDGERTAPVVPASAVQNLGARQIVFKATAQPNVFELRPVRLGSESDGRYAVLEGLNVGDRIVTTGSFLLRAEWLKRQ
jgi:RND family efflux transporter, MFP subunit